METSKYRYHEDFEVAIDYWIFCKQYQNLQEAREILSDEIFYSRNLQDPILIDMNRALKKLNTLTEKEYLDIKHNLDNYFFEESQIAFRNYQNFNSKIK